jgi:hypothetical protein
MRDWLKPVSPATNFDSIIVAKTAYFGMRLQRIGRDDYIITGMR